MSQRGQWDGGGAWVSFPPKRQQPLGNGHESLQPPPTGRNCHEGHSVGTTSSRFGLQRHGREGGEEDDGIGVGIPRNVGRPRVGLGWPVRSCSEPAYSFQRNRTVLYSEARAPGAPSHGAHFPILQESHLRLREGGPSTKVTQESGSLQGVELLVALLGLGGGCRFA